MLSRALLRSSWRSSQLQCRRFSLTAALANEAKPGAPPMLAQIRSDLKTAMQAKDAPRLAVLRAVLAATLNASKTAAPIATDAQLLALFRKHATAARDAAAEFRAAGRDDLAAKEDTQAAVMAEYMSSLAADMVGADEIRAVAARVVEAMRAAGDELRMGDVMKRVLGKDGLGDKMVEKSEVALVVKQLIAGK